MLVDTVKEDCITMSEANVVARVRGFHFVMDDVMFVYPIEDFSVAMHDNSNSVKRAPDVPPTFKLGNVQDCDPNDVSRVFHNACSICSSRDLFFLLKHPCIYQQATL